MTTERTTAPSRQVHRPDRTTAQPRQVHLAAHFPGVNNTTVWTDPDSGSQIDFSSFRHLARTAERGRFDFLFLAEGLRLRERKGLIHDLDVVGRPDSLTVLNAVAAVTERLGLAATVNATFNEPYELARRFSSLDHLSGGRAAWNVVTTSDAFTGENFRRGGYLDRADRYRRAEEFVEVARALWDAWPPGRSPRTVRHSGPQFDLAARPALPHSPQQHPVLIQAGDSDEGREFAARSADVVFSRHGSLEAGRAFHTDVKRRLARYGRRPEDLLILPAATFVLGYTDAEAQERAALIRRQQVSPATALAFLENVWGRDLSGYDPDGPLPGVDPVPDSELVQGWAQAGDRFGIAARWRAHAEEKHLSIRELAIEQTARQSFVGTAESVAAAIDAHVQAEAADGFILVPHLTPGGLDEFVDRVVPLLQERGVFRADYAGTTLRDHLGLARPGSVREEGAAS
ncbi:NtaA/DmoA family FMN-dependent monooxygenase [Streptomyces mesophilus]|uniref:NtaA/DmoA family FMN-dependent monooxygenase n=1 Tax=Streptomyces mesophilus TaxID=1775132 RepID=UPI0033227456